MPNESKKFPVELVFDSSAVSFPGVEIFVSSGRSVNNIKLLFKASRERAARKLAVLSRNISRDFSRSNVSKLMHPILYRYARTGNLLCLLFTTGASTFQPPPTLPLSFIPRFAESLILHRRIHRTSPVCVCVCVYMCVRRNDYVIHNGKKVLQRNCTLADNFNRTILLT